MCARALGSPTALAPKVSRSLPFLTRHPPLTLSKGNQKGKRTS